MEEKKVRKYASTQREKSWWTLFGLTTKAGNIITYHWHCTVGDKPDFNLDFNLVIFVPIMHSARTDVVRPGIINDFIAQQRHRRHYS